MSVEKINESALAAEGFFHTTQKDVPGKTAQEMKEFFDRLPREVLIPKINEIIEQAEADKKETAENLKNKADGNSVYTKTEADVLLKNKADGNSVYTKTEADVLLENKADGDSVYTKTEADALLENKADGDSVYTKTEADALLENKADGDSVYTKTEADKLLKKKIDANKAALEFANALKGTASGVSVSVDDASPLEHDLNVKLESKNLFTTDYYKIQYGTSNRKLEGNNFEFTSEMDAKGQSHVDFDIYLEAGTYYLSGDDISTSNSAFKGGYAIMKGNDFIVNRATSTTIGSIINITESGTYTFNFYGDYAADVGTVYTYSNIQLERGSSKTNFTHFTYVEGITVSKLIVDFEVQSADASADGTVEGLVSSPSFELTSSVKDGSVLINLEYNRDINTITFGDGTGDGFFPIAKVEQTESGAVITIIDKNGTTTAIVKNGKDGDTYTLTEADKTGIINAVIDSIGVPIFGTIDENKNINLSGNLAKGTYTLRFENNGEYDELCTYTVGKAEIVNLLPNALTPNDITTVFNGVGYMNGKYASAAEPFYNTDAAFFCSGLMPIPASRTFYIKGCTMDTSLSHTRFGLMLENGSLHNTAKLSDWGTGITFTELGEQYYSVKIAETSTTVFYFYFSASGTGEGVIVSATPIDDSNQSEAPDTTLTLEAGLKIDSSTGAETPENASYSASNYIEIVDGFTYTVYKKSSISEGLKVCYYDAEKNFISTSGDVIVSTTNQTSAAIPLIDGASFFRLRIYGTASLLDATKWEVTAEVSA